MLPVQKLRMTFLNSTAWCRQLGLGSFHLIITVYILHSQVRRSMEVGLKTFWQIQNLLGK